MASFLGQHIVQLEHVPVVLAVVAVSSAEELLLEHRSDPVEVADAPDV